MNPATELDCELKRIEVLDNELARLHAYFEKSKNNEVRRWAADRIEEIQAVVLGAQMIVVPESAASDSNTGDLN